MSQIATLHASTEDTLMKPHAGRNNLYGHRLLQFVLTCYNNRVAFITLPPFSIEASHPGLMRQFELYALNIPT